MRHRLSCSAAIVVILLGAETVGYTRDFPAAQWKQYVRSEDAGFSSQKLDAGRLAFEASQAAALLVIHDGRVLVSWGETTRRFRCASVRKSLISALYGIYVDRGKIDLDETLADLEIDDIQGLTYAEKQATVRDLLSSRSGVYHSAAHSPRGMEESLPTRGSHEPGTFWFYNNWDFNVLSTIFEKRTGEGVFEIFDRQIAQPLEMEDFDLSHTYYRYERDKSEHPAYLFRMSARDLARFGLLYLNRGRWDGKQIIPEAWIEESTSPVTEQLGRFNSRGSYGYLWWVSDGVSDEPMYFASGSGGQRICVLPKSNLVLVHTVNTYENNNVGQEQIEKLISLILDAKVTDPRSSPELTDYQAPAKETASTTVDSAVLKTYEGNYRHQFLGEFKIRADGNQLIMEGNIGRFKLRPVSENQFIPEDIETPALFEKAGPSDKAFTIATVFDENRNLVKVVLYY